MINLGLNIILSSVFLQIKALGFNPSAIYSKVLNEMKFNILVTIPEKEFIDDKVFSVYECLSKIEDEFKLDNFFLNFSLCSTNDGFNEKNILNEGYGKLYIK